MRMLALAAALAAGLDGAAAQAPSRAEAATTAQLAEWHAATTLIGRCPASAYRGRNVERTQREIALRLQQLTADRMDLVSAQREARLATERRVERILYSDQKRACMELVDILDAANAFLRSQPAP